MPKYKTFFRVVFVDVGPDPTVHLSELVFPERKLATARQVVQWHNDRDDGKFGVVARLARLRLRADDPTQARIMRKARAHTRGEHTAEDYAFDLLSGVFRVGKAKGLVG